MKKYKDLVASIAVPIIALLLGVVLSVFGSFSLQEGIIISLLLSVAATVIELKYITDSNIKDLITKIKHLEFEVRNIQQTQQISNQIQQQSHPYFQKRIKQATESFFEENIELFNGTCVTNPHDIFTFGVDGITYTKENGCIKAVSSVEDYWEDDFTNPYLDAQKQLIDEKRVNIQRIFVFPESEFTERESLLKKQAELGIDVYYIFSENRFVNPEWLSEDYLIQDNELLVDIKCSSHSFKDTDDKTETITTHPAAVKLKLMRFEKLLEYSTHYPRTK